MNIFQHWGDTIYWDRLSWEAFAALMAVLAAGVVGWRQVGIQQRQVEIAALEVATTLWGERLKVYDATSRYLSHIMTHSSVPGRMTLAANVYSKDVSAPEIALDFMNGLDRSRFLFRAPVRAELERIYRLAEELADIIGSADILYEPGKTTMPKRAAAIRSELGQVYANVAGLFGDELQLTQRSRSRVMGRGL